MKKTSLFVTVLLVLSLALCACGGGTEKEKADISNAVDLAGLKGATIGAQPGTVFEEVLSQIEDVNPVVSYPEIPDLIVALKAGSIDGFICERPQAVAADQKNDDLSYIALENNKTGFTVSEEQSGIAIGLKKGSELGAQINAILSEISEETREALMAEMIKLSAGEKLDKLSLEIPEVKEYKGTLKVGMECASEPWNWTQFEDGMGAVPISGEGKDGMFANGYDVVISEYVAAKLGLKLEVYAYDWNSLIPGVQSGALDAIIAGMSPTAERKEVIDFTDLYYNVNYVVMYKK